jgi:hypothetical protein
VDQVGNYVSFFGDTPALAVDMALHGPNANHVGYDLAYGLQMAPTAIDVYPRMTAPFSGGGLMDFTDFLKNVRDGANLVPIVGPYIGSGPSVTSWAMTQAPRARRWISTS